MKIKDIESEYFGVTVFSWFTEEFFKGWDFVLGHLLRLVWRSCCVRKKDGFRTSQTNIYIVFLHFLIMGS